MTVDIVLMVRSALFFSICYLFVLTATPGVFSLLPAAEAELSQREKALRQIRRRTLARDVQITSVVAYDRGTISDNATDSTLDTSQETCSDSSDEPFFDSLLGIRLKNTRLVPLQVRRVYYVVRGAFGSRGKFKAHRHSPVGNNEVPADGEEVIAALFLDTDSGRKYYAGAQQPVPVDLGFRTLKVRVVGRDLSGQRFRVVRKTTFSFGNPDRCD